MTRKTEDEKINGGEEKTDDKKNEGGEYKRRKS